MLVLLAVFGGGSTLAVLLKNPAKVIAVGNSHALRNLGNGIFRVYEQPLGATDTVAVEIVNGGDSDLGAKAAVHIVDRKIDLCRKALLGNV